MALKVFDLQCELHHVFEGWFRSHDDYEQQVQQQLLRCPFCNSLQIEKKLSAPRLNLSHTTHRESASSQVTDNTTAIQAQWLQQIKAMIKKTEDVGDNFVSEVRKMHEGDVPERAIRGSATKDEYQELQSEGIDVLPIPDYLDEDKLN